MRLESSIRVLFFVGYGRKGRLCIVLLEYQCIILIGWFCILLWNCTPQMRSVIGLPFSSRKSSLYRTVVFGTSWFYAKKSIKCFLSLDDFTVVVLIICRHCCLFLYIPLPSTTTRRRAFQYNSFRSKGQGSTSKNLLISDAPHFILLSILMISEFML